MIELQEIKSPKNGLITTHEFYTYDPLNEFNIEHSVNFLSEDLLQCFFPVEDVKVDLGWYGNVRENKGEFRIHIIQSENWEYPVKTIYSKDVDEIKTLLENIFRHFASL